MKRALLGLILAATGFGAQDPAPISGADVLAQLTSRPLEYGADGALRVFSIKAEFDRTTANPANARETSTKPVGAVELDFIRDAQRTVVVSTVDPVTKRAEATVYSYGEIASVLRAMAAAEWARVNPPALPVSKARRQPAVATTP